MANAVFKTSVLIFEKQQLQSFLANSNNEEGVVYLSKFDLYCVTRA